MAQAGLFANFLVGAEIGGEQGVCALNIIGQKQARNVELRLLGKKGVVIKSLKQLDYASQITDDGVVVAYPVNAVLPYLKDAHEMDVFAIHQGKAARVYACFKFFYRAIRKVLFHKEDYALRERCIGNIFVLIWPNLEFNSKFGQNYFIFMGVSVLRCCIL